MQVSTNVHDPIAVPLAEVVDIVAGLLRPGGGVLESAEIVGLVPEAALAGFPASVPIQGFDPDTPDRRAAGRPRPGWLTSQTGSGFTDNFSGDAR